MLTRLTILLFLFASLTRAQPQEPIAVDAKTLQQHVLKREPPFYPPIAKAAQVEGTVVLKIQVDAKGNVEWAKAISGPQMLIQAAIDSVKQRTYKPFEKDGRPIPAQGPVNMIYTLGGSSGSAGSPTPGSSTESASKVITVHVRADDNSRPLDDKAASEYDKFWEDCTKGVLAHANTDATVAACRNASDTATRFGVESGYLEKRASSVYAATALANVGSFKDALTYADRAVEVVQLGHDDNAGSEAAYATRGTIKVYLGDLGSADKDLEVAEEFERKAIASMEKDGAIAQAYRRSLARDLKIHAEVLKGLNRSSDAQAKLDEVSKLGVN
jgi:TonB family protein